MRATTFSLLAVVLMAFACKTGKKIDEDSGVPFFRIIDVHPGPVIKLGDPGTEGNKYGFEGGRAHKINGTYHLFTTEPYADPHAVNTRLAHWTSRDGLNWAREGHVMQSGGDYTGTDQKAALWSPMTYFIDNNWYMSYVAYKAAPNLDTAFKANFEGQIWLTASQTHGLEGIDGPYLDTLILFGVDENSQSWEGLQGVDSWYPYQLGDGTWLSFYGSAKSQFNPIPFWGVGLAESDSFFGPWKRKEGTNPVLIDSVFVENPIVEKLPKGWYVAFIDGGPVNQFGYAISEDGVHWSHATYINLTEKTERWWRQAFGMRTPLGLIPEGDDVYTLFFTAFDENNWANLGMCKLELNWK